MVKGSVRKARKEARPAEIVEAAFQEFAAKGFLGARVEDIAARLGVTKGTVYLYFPSKEVLFAAVLDTFGAQMRRETDDHVAELHGDVAERLEQLIVHLNVSSASDQRLRSLLVLSIAERERFPEVIERQFRATVDHAAELCLSLLQEGAAAGVFHAHVASRNTALTLVSPCLWLVLSGVMHPNEPSDVDGFVAQQLRLLRDGLFREPSAPSL
ncbi:TetR/AcrR family transcriptional regulator [Oryzibacter oryziterrae]|uniref:TetR/AcrR family transcriptional regulator n=1 Tax=Oryzibacter oryziterrae TaxID=2766474 RepID=UPI001F1FE8E6|nr:TetR/AcrR family transcriptional regulator [Oryzibacter oryziterrae]